MNRISVLLLLITVLSACNPGELPIAPPAPTSVETYQVKMGANYADQIFFNLTTGTIISSNAKEEWDLGFEADSFGWRIYLNSARGGAIYRTGETELSTVSDTTGAQWRYDSSSGNPDSNAAGDYRTINEVLLIDRGYNVDGIHTGYRKLKVESISNSAYTCRVMKLDGSNEALIEVPKDPDRNRVAVSLESNSVVDIEPESILWDLLFTQYTYIFDDPPIAYLVVGVLINHERIEVAPAHDIAFDAIDITHARDLIYLRAVDAIGYNWKEYDFNSGTFIVLPGMNYLIHDADGRYFKLHFIDFYTINGEKGAPTLEVQELF